MKRFILLLFLGATCAYGAANEVIMSQVKPTGTGNTERRVLPTPNSLLGFDSNGLPANVTAGTGITISNNQISSSGSGVSFPLVDSTAIAASTATPRITLSNSAAATNGNPRYSPFIEQDGFTYNSVGGSKSMRFKFGVETRSNSGGTQAGEFVIDSSLDGGAWVQAMKLGPDGNLTVPYIQTSAGFIYSAAEVTATTYLESLGNSLLLRDTAGSGGSLKLKTATTSTNDILTINANGASRALSIPGDATISGTNTGDQTITLTGEVTGSGTGSFAATIAAGSVTLAKQANMATSSLVYRKTAGAGAPEVNTLATLKTDLGLTGANSGDQTISVTGDGTASGSTGALSLTVTKINGTSLGGLSTGILRNTTTTGVPSIAAAGTDYVAPGGALGTPSSGTLTNATGLPVSGITSSTSTALGVGSLELGGASDTTLARSAAGVMTIEGNQVFAANTKTDVLQAADFAADAGANDTYTATLSPAITAYVTGARYRFKANTANTGAATINFNSLGAKTIVKLAGGITTALADNDILAGQWVECVYDGTNMQMESQLGNPASGYGDVVAANGNALSGQNTSTLGFEFAWTSQSTGSQNYAVNKRYYISTFTSSSTATFTGTPANGSTIIIQLIACDGTSTFTYPTAQRDGDVTGTSTVITPTAGEHVLAFRYVNSLWYFSDTITTAVVSDTAYGSGWNGVTAIAGSKNAIYDQLHIGDTDDDGKPDVLDQVAGIVNTNSGGVIQTPITTHAGLVAVVTDLNSATRTATNLTLDANATGNVFKWIEEINLTHPHQVDGTGAVLNTTATAATYGHATFANATAKATNYVLYRMTVPFDFDTATDLAASFAFRLGGSDTGKHAYKLSMADVADSAGADLPTFSNEIALTFAGDASGASGDVETVAYTTLTSWKAGLTAGHILVMKLARDGSDGTNDTSTVDSTDVVLKLKIGHSQ